MSLQKKLTKKQTLIFFSNEQLTMKQQDDDANYYIILQIPVYCHPHIQTLFLLCPRTESVTKQRGGVVSQETAADSSFSFRYSEELRCQV